MKTAQRTLCAVVSALSLVGFSQRVQAQSAPATTYNVTYTDANGLDLKVIAGRDSVETRSAPGDNSFDKRGIASCTVTNNGTPTDYATPAAAQAHCGTAFEKYVDGIFKELQNGVVVSTKYFLDELKQNPPLAVNSVTNGRLVITDFNVSANNSNYSLVIKDDELQEFIVKDARNTPLLKYVNDSSLSYVISRGGNQYNFNFTNLPPKKRDVVAGYFKGVADAVLDAVTQYEVRYNDANGLKLRVTRGADSVEIKSSPGENSFKKAGIVYCKTIKGTGVYTFSLPAKAQENCEEMFEKYTTALFGELRAGVDSYVTNFLNIFQHTTPSATTTNDGRLIVRDFVVDDSGSRLSYSLVIQNGELQKFSVEDSTTHEFRLKYVKDQQLSYDVVSARNGRYTINLRNLPSEEARQVAGYSGTLASTVQEAIKTKIAH